MPSGFERYYRRETIRLTCQVVTPMFLGNANGEAEWRAAPFKSLLRYWWRISQPKIESIGDLLKQESVLFGAAGDDNDSQHEQSGKSVVWLTVQSTAKSVKEPLSSKKTQKITHPELTNQVDPLVYLAGMGLLESGKPKNPFFKPGSEFDLFISYPPDKKEQMETVLMLIQAFGAVGGRSRNGWGSFQFTSEIFDISIAAKRLSAITMPDWKDCMKKDYPNGLGKSPEKRLLWKTKSYHKTWEDTLMSLAEMYIAVRAGNADLPKLDPGGVKGSPKAGERHLLGVPLTHHPISHDENVRHASALRFAIKKRSEGYMGFVLHVPHAFGLEIPSTINQIEVWEKVHNKLDAIMERANYEECL